MIMMVVHMNRATGSPDRDAIRRTVDTGSKNGTESIGGRALLAPRKGFDRIGCKRFRRDNRMMVGIVAGVEALWAREMVPICGLVSEYYTPACGHTGCWSTCKYAAKHHASGVESLREHNTKLCVQHIQS
mmetsp:Transcript_21700/g.60307  ORF Transcript_21700/g.60307 Transcript_21700/m.60307 type:complete len:130 (+) Transcript_21700:556-945(+)